MIRKSYASLVGLLGMLSFTACSEVVLSSDVEDPIACVKPYIGGISHLLEPTQPAVYLPNSMMRVVPQRKDVTSDQLEGLPLILTSHRGKSAFRLSPLASPLDSLPDTIRYTYDHEEVTPYLYSVYLHEPELRVRYAPSHQSAIYELRYEGEAVKPTLLLRTDRGELIAKGNSLSGYERLNDSVNVYLYLETQQMPEHIQEQDKQTLAFVYPEGKALDIRYGVSYISSEQAKANMLREVQVYSLDLVAKAGRHTWEEALGNIEIEGGEQAQREVFYTAFYRTFERMINVSEGGYYFSPQRGEVLGDEGIPQYTDDWVWDTYLATHPLRILIEPERQQHILTSYLRMAGETKEQWLPTFPEVTGDSHRMNGNHAISLFADAYAKGLSGFDLDKAYDYARKTLEEKSYLPWTRRPKGMLTEHLHKHGYFPALALGEKESYPEVTKWEKRQSVAVSLASSYDYWTLSLLAKYLGRDEEATQYLKRAYDYRKSYNYETGFFHPRSKDGRFVLPLDYELGGGLGARDYYDENNAYTYRWDVKHNVADLIRLMGGEAQFIRNLDETFRTPLSQSKWVFYGKLPDQTGNVGQFSMGNEVGFHIPYLYNYAGAPWRTQRAIRRLLDQWFRSDLMGIPGDEDGGGMSAFVVFSMMGIYPVTPGLPVYNIGTPSFERTTIKLSRGRTFNIRAEHLSRENFYIQSASLNGKTLDRPWLKHSEVIQGGELVLEMGARPNKHWGAKMPPPSAERIQE